MHGSSDKIEIEQLDALDLEFSGVRYVKNDGFIQWDTRLVFCSGANSRWIGVQIDVNSSFPAAWVPPAKKPLFVKTFLSQLGGGDDGELTVGREPRELDEQSLETVADIVLGRSNCRMPVVYVSAPFKGDYLVDPKLLADRLSGMAHVIVEPDRQFSRRLAEATAGRNVYGGTLAVHWPNGGGRRIYYFSRQYKSLAELEDDLVDEVRVALTNKRLSKVLTWENLRELAGWFQD